MNKNLYIGLMSGTSADAIDATIVDFKKSKVNIINKIGFSIPKNIKERILSFKDYKTIKVKDLYSLEYDLSILFSACVKKLLLESKFKAQDINATGSHGQTIWHCPDSSKPYTIQLGDPNIISSITKIKTVSDFRRMDIACGGQGAPLTPLFHAEFLGNKNKTTSIINIGGIANISLLDGKKNQTLGFDSGPGNCLMDLWTNKNTKYSLDNKGKMAREGNVNQNLLKECLKDSFFKKKHPKSSGPDFFNFEWLNQKLSSVKADISFKDVLATLLFLTIESISVSIENLSKNIEHTYICGGGAKNLYLIECLEKRLAKKIQSTEVLGIDPDFLESACFAWLAKKRLENYSFSMNQITGNKHNLLLGTIWTPPVIIK